MALINEKAVLVQLSISQWTARKIDKKVTSDVATQNGTDSTVGRYNKVLLPLGTYLKDVHSMTTTIRTHFYNNTLCWGLEGTQLLPSANYLEFMSQYREFKSEWLKRVERFLDAYPYLKNQAKVQLKGLYNEKDYPDTDAIRRKFSIDLATFPVPASDFRVEIQDEELTAIQQEVESRVLAAQQQAMNDVWNRLHERVKVMAEKLADPSAIFRDSLVENAKEICSLLPRLNFADDPNLESMRQEVLTELAGQHPDALRNDPDLRREKADKAKDILDKMGVFMGGL